MPGLKYWWCLLCAAASMAPAVPAQVARPDGAVLSTDTEVGSLSSWSIGAEARTRPLGGGEALEGLGPGVGASVSAGVAFDERIALRAALGWASYNDELAADRAVMVDLLLDLAWRGEAGELRVDLGPTLGYSWLDRGIYTHRNGGLVAGAVVRVYRALTGTVDLVGSVAGHWTSYPSPPLLPPAGSDPDNRALAVQLEVAIGLSWSFGRAGGEGR